MKAQVAAIALFSITTAIAQDINQVSLCGVACINIQAVAANLPGAEADYQCGDFSRSSVLACAELCLDPDTPQQIDAYMDQFCAAAQPTDFIPLPTKEPDFDRR